MIIAIRNCRGNHLFQWLPHLSCSFFTFSHVLLLISQEMNSTKKTDFFHVTSSSTTCGIASSSDIFIRCRIAASGDCETVVCEGRERKERCWWVRTESVDCSVSPTKEPSSSSTPKVLLSLLGSFIEQVGRLPNYRIGSLSRLKGSSGSWSTSAFGFANDEYGLVLVSRWWAQTQAEANYSRCTTSSSPSLKSCLKKGSKSVRITGFLSCALWPKTPGGREAAVTASLERQFRTNRYCNKTKALLCWLANFVCCVVMEQSNTTSHCLWPP